jgi:hypothetical protein
MSVINARAVSNAEWPPPPADLPGDPHEPWRDEPDEPMIDLPGEPREPWNPPDEPDESPPDRKRCAVLSEEEEEDLPGEPLEPYVPPPRPDSNPAKAPPSEAPAAPDKPAVRPDTHPQLACFSHRDYDWPPLRFAAGSDDVEQSATQHRTRCCFARGAGARLLRVALWR